MIELFSDDLIATMQAHAIASFPNEATGFVYADRYEPVANIAADPINQFEVAPQDYIDHQGAIAFIHSHPVADAFSGHYKPGFYPHCPSGADMQSQIATGMPFGIIVTDGVNAREPFFWGDFLLDTPLYERTFRHGVEDCYTIIRKWFWQNRGIKLPDFARDHDWWFRGENLYMNNFPGVGFRRLGSGETFQEGDCGIIPLGGSRGASILNHAFVYLGDGTICHHLPGRLSSRDAIGGRISEVNIWVRHSGSSETPVNNAIPMDDEVVIENFSPEELPVLEEDHEELIIEEPVEEVENAS